MYHPLSWVLVLGLVVVVVRAVKPRIDCHPEPYPTETNCNQRGCIWNADPATALREPPCYYSNATGYVLSKPGSLVPTASSKNPYYSNLENIEFSSEYIGQTLNVKLFAEGRFNPEIDLPRKGSVSKEKFSIQTTTVQGEIFSFVVKRDSSNETIWDTSIGGLLFGDQYIQIATLLPTKNIYGFGEHIHKSISHNMDRYTTWPMYAHGVLPDSYAHLSTRNLYGVHPFYMAMEHDGNAHGVLILNSNAQEVTLGPGPHLVYRTLGGNLDMYFFPGPNPEQVVQQYLAFVGTPFMPAYWAFGYQLGRSGYGSRKDMTDIMDKTVNDGIPLETVVADIDYMDADNDFTLGDKWKDLPAYAKQLHTAGMHLSLIVDPQVQVIYPAFQRAINKSASFVEWPEASLVEDLNHQYSITNGTLIMLSNSWPKNNIATPDFMDPSGRTHAWWQNELDLFHAKVDYDTLWIDMDESTNFFVESNVGVNSEVDWSHLKCPVNGKYGNVNKPKYETWAAYIYGENLFSDTNCLLGTVAEGKHTLYDTHNLYGLFTTKHTYMAQNLVLQKRGAMISRSTFPSSGRYGGHTLGQNSALWEDLQTSVIGMMEFNMFGIPFVGAEICGYSGNCEEELCSRWHQLGAFYPFSRNYNGPANNPHYPTYYDGWISKSWVPIDARNSLAFRYHYLPYLYTLFDSVNRLGGTVVRPLFFEFPQDKATYNISTQFMWGSGMMFAPVLSQGVKTVSAYLPPSAKWYSLRETDYGTALGTASSTTVTLSGKQGEVIPVMARGGTIIPRQAYSQFLKDARLNPFELLISLEADQKNITNTANGSLYWDDGNSLDTEDYFNMGIEFTASEYYATLTITPRHRGNVSLPTLDLIEILGYVYFADMDTIRLNGDPLPKSSTTKSDHNKQILTINGSQLINWKAPGVHKFTWDHWRNEHHGTPTTTQRPTTTTTTTKAPTKAPTTTTSTKAPTKAPTTTTSTKAPTKAPTTTTSTKTPTKAPTTTSTTSISTKAPTTTTSTKAPTTTSTTSISTKAPTTSSTTTTDASRTTTTTGASTTTEKHHHHTARTPTTTSASSRARLGWVSVLSITCALLIAH